MPTGTECYKTVTVDPKSCIISCKGLYADVVKNNEFKPIEEITKFKNVLSEYEDFKKAYIRDGRYSQKLQGKNLVPRIQNSCFFVNL